MVRGCQAPVFLASPWQAHQTLVCPWTSLFTAKGSATLYSTEGLKEYPVSLPGRQKGSPEALKELLTIVSAEATDCRGILNYS